MNRADPPDAAAALDLLATLGDALRPLDDPARIEAAAARLIGEALAAERAAYLHEVGGDARAVAIDADGIATLRAGEVVVTAREAIVPLFDGQDLAAVFLLHWAESQAVAADTARVVRLAAERGWLSIGAARARAAHRQSEARLIAAFESVPVGLAVIDPRGEVVIANSEYRSYLPSGTIPSQDPENRWRWHGWDEAGAPLGKHDFPGERSLRGERVVPGQEMLHTGTDGAERWARVASVPIHDEGGAIVGISSVISDIDTLKRTADALRESRTRTELIVNDIGTAVWEAAPDGLVNADSPSWRAYSGQSYEEWRGYGWLDAIHPDDRAATLARWHAAVHERRGVDAEYRLRRADGAYRWMNVRAVPVHDDNGRLYKWLGINIDIDERKRLEEANRDAERRVRALMEGVPQLLWRSAEGGRWTWASPQWTLFTGQDEEESYGAGWLERIHPDDRHAVTVAWAGAATTGGFEIEYRVRHRDGDYRWFTTRALPVRGDGGEILEWLGTSNDTDALHKAQDRQTVMVAELQHRTRNLIAVIQSLADKTIERAPSLPQFAHDFGERLAALSRVQGLLSQATAGRKVTFDELVRAELVALGALDRDGRGEQVVLDGPAGVRLRSSAVQSLALAIHELATNAVKHGALATRSGRLAVSWWVDHPPGGRALVVEWRETGGPTRDVAAEETRGYGRELIERSLPYQLGAKTTYSLDRSGVRCIVAVPLGTRDAENGR